MTAIKLPPLPRRGTNEQWVIYITAKSVVEPSGCHSYGGRKDKYPMAGRQRISRRLLGLAKGDPREAMHSCNTNWCINPEHLSVGTHQQNLADAGADGLMHRPHSTKLTIEQAHAVREDSRTQSAIAADYGIDQSMVSKIKTRRSWR